MWAKPSGLKFLSSCGPSLSQHHINWFQSVLPSRPASLRHPNERTRFRKVWAPRGPSAGASRGPWVWTCLGHGHVHTQAAALPHGTVLTVSFHSRPGHSPAMDSALLCLCLAVSLLPFEQISLLHCTGLLYF